MDPTSRIIVSRFVTIPYSPEELSTMSEQERETIRIERLEKIVDEVILDKFDLVDRGQLRNKVEASIARNHHAVVVYSGDASKDAFIFQEGYNRDHPGGILEVIVFRRNDRMTTSNPHPSPELMNDERPVEDNYKLFSLRSRSNRDLLSFTTYQTGSRMIVPSLNIGSDDSVLCRIIGDDYSEVARAEQYFFRLKRIDGRIGAVSNHILRGGGRSGSLEWIPAPGLP